MSQSPRRWPWCVSAWIAAGCVGVVDVVWLASTPLHLTDSSYVILVSMMPLIAAGLWVSTHREPKSRLHVVISGLSLLLVAWPVLRLYNHLIMTISFPLTDERLARWDEMIRFDWVGYVTWLERYPVLIRVLDLSYQNLTNYSIVLFLLLALGSRPAEACAELMSLFVAAALICSTIGAFFPALSAVVHHAPNGILYENIPPYTGAYHIEALLALRSKDDLGFDLNNLPGLTTFPSFHTAMGILGIYCSRRHSILLGVSIAFNLSMIVSTPVFGAHYGVDILAGMLVAVAAILVRKIIVDGLSSRLPATNAMQLAAGRQKAEPPRATA